jgi:hypothetical protein
LEETVADFCGAEVLADRLTVELRVLLDGVLRTALVFGLTDELFVLLLCTASCLTERVVPILSEALVLFLSERDTVFPRDGFTVEFRVVPDFSLTEVPESILPLLTVADFRVASFLDETEERVADERLSPAEPLFTRAL